MSLKAQENISLLRKLPMNKDHFVHYAVSIHRWTIRKKLGFPSVHGKAHFFPTVFLMPASPLCDTEKFTPDISGHQVHGGFSPQ